MRIAIIGSGIAGNVAAHHLQREHDITVFEADSHVGGHTHTHCVEQNGRHFQVDTGFIVFNDRTYPNFIHLLNELDVPSQPSNMSFSVKCARTGLEYNGTSINSLFAQRRNVLRPSFWRMVHDILRFNKEAPGLLQANAPEISLGEYLRQGCYSQGFIAHYIVPMGAAIWSTAPDAIREMPAPYFVRFFHNHGMLSVGDRPQWRVIQGGSARYVEKLIAPFRHRIRLNTPVDSVARSAGRVLVKPRGAVAEAFDAVFFACHSDQALKLLADPSAQERAVLGAIPYQQNEVVLHTDTTLLPRNRRAWAAWNYHVLPETAGPAMLTYNMNILQGLDARTPFLVTLNRTNAIDPKRIIKRLTYHHPVFTREGVAAQARQRELNSAPNTFYCGAWWGFGFHEDGVVSALSALQHFREQLNAQRTLRRSA